MLKEDSGGAGSRIPPSDAGFDRSRSVSDGSAVGHGQQVANAVSGSIGIDRSAGSNVEDADPVRDNLVGALAQWISAPEVRLLRTMLLKILIALE